MMYLKKMCLVAIVTGMCFLSKNKVYFGHFQVKFNPKLMGSVGKKERFFKF